jgi:hypothetical protein
MSTFFPSSNSLTCSATRAKRRVETSLHLNITCTGQPSVHEGTLDDADGDDVDSVEEDWEVLAHQLPARDGTGVDTSAQLGKRAFDLQYAWDDKIRTHLDLTAD